MVAVSRTVFLGLLAALTFQTDAIAGGKDCFKGPHGKLLCNETPNKFRQAQARSIASEAVARAKLKKAHHSNVAHAQHMGQPMGQPIGQPIGQPLSQAGQPMGQPVGQPLSQPGQPMMGQTLTESGEIDPVHAVRSISSGAN